MPTKKKKVVKRRKRQLSITVEPAVHARVMELKRILPGSTVSGIVTELLTISMPVMEEMARSMVEARRPDGSMDEDRARDRLARWAGAQLLGLSDTFDLPLREERPKTTP